MGRTAAWIAGVLAGLVLLLAVASILVDEPLRRYIEREMNARLTGYTVRLERLDFHPLGFAIDFHGLTLLQQAHPDPPVARFPRITASVDWRALLHRRLVADFALERPALHVNLIHLRREAEDEVPVDARGWAAAVQAMYPLKINEVRIRDGELVYIDRPEAGPLRLRGVQARAGNIRNVRSEARVYPSPLRLEATVFDRGRLVVDGHADFLAEPHAGVLAQVAVQGVDLGALRSVTARYPVQVRAGVVALAGDIEYGPTVKAVHLERLVLRGAEIDYLWSAGTAAPSRRAARAAAGAAGAAANRPDVQLRVDRLEVTGSTFGFVNRAAAPPYRVFLAGTELTVENLSNNLTEGTATAQLTGRFMGSGRAVAAATFRPEVRGPDFDLSVEIVNTDLRRMNELLQAYGRFDVVSGLFSVYSELSVKRQTVQGYIKPLFRDLDVYDERQDADKSLFRKVYEGLVGGVARLLENRPREEVATRADVVGPIEDPETRTWPVVVRLIGNAFFRAILPGFEQEVARQARR